MIWSIIKIILFVGFVTALTIAAGFLIETGGEVRVAIGVMEFSLTPLVGLIVVLLILMGGWLAFRVAGLLVAVFRFFNGDETAISRYFDRNRERRGFEALADGLMALASGEGRLAMAKATRAEKYLNRPELTLLISAQAAEMSGETQRAQGYYKKLLADDRTRFVGIQGILKQKLAEGETDTALKLAEKAFALRPRHEKTMDLLFSLQSGNADWKGARDTLSAKLKVRALPKDVYTRRDAVLALAEAREKIEAGEIQNGTASAILANKLSPDLVPAAVLAAEMHVVENTPKAAAKVLKKAWGILPHPDLAAAFADINPDETAEQRLARFQPLLKLNPEAPETGLLAAELSIAAEDFAAARKAMGDLAETHPTIRSLTMMAAIERGEGSTDNVVRGWLTQALGAPRGPQWMCSSCKHIHGSWVPICENCEGFDTLSWEVPPPVSEPDQRSTDLLPLIVGALEDGSAVAEDIADAAVVPETAEPEKPEPKAPVSEAPVAAAAKQSPKIVTLPQSTNMADLVSGESDDMDGILGDSHMIEEIKNAKT